MRFIITAVIIVMCIWICILIDTQKEDTLEKVMRDTFDPEEDMEEVEWEEIVYTDHGDGEKEAVEKEVVEDKQDD